MIEMINRIIIMPPIIHHESQKELTALGSNDGAQIALAVVGSLLIAAVIIWGIIEAIEGELNPWIVLGITIVVATIIGCAFFIPLALVYTNDRINKDWIQGVRNELTDYDLPLNVKDWINVDTSEWTNAHKALWNDFVLPIVEKHINGLPIK